MDAGKWGFVHIHRRFEDDVIVFRFVQDDFAIFVDPRKHAERGGVIDEVIARLDTLERFGVQWFHMYQRELAGARACRS